MSVKVHYITVDSSSDELDYEIEPEPVTVKCEDEGAVTSPTELDYEAIIFRIANLEGQMKRSKEDIKSTIENAKKAIVDDSRSFSYEAQGVSSRKAALVYMSGPQSKFEVRDVARMLKHQQGSLLAICPKISPGGTLYYILVIREPFAGKIVDEIDGLVYEGRTMRALYADDRGLDIGHILRNHGGQL